VDGIATLAVLVGLSSCDATHQARAQPEDAAALGLAAAGGAVSAVGE
jgi:hypothetical protein